MAIAASSVTPTNSLEDFRIEFNNLVSDVTGITATNKFTENIIFEGATADAYETTFTVTDPTADRTLTLPNATDTIVGRATTDTLTNKTITAAIVATSFDMNGAELILDADADTSITSDTDDQIDIRIAGADDFQFTANTFTAQTGSTIAAQALTATTGVFSSDITGLTINATGDTAADDAAAIGYTSVEGLILTGQGSTNDVTIKNDADADVIEIPTGTTNVTIAGTLTTGGTITATTSIGIGSAVLAEAELELLDGLTAGTAVASKVVTTDASIDTTGQRNLTISGELDAATLDISGAIDVAGNSVLASVDVTGVATASTFEPDGDTAADDAAAIGYTSVEGLILTGQGSTNDVTIKNDADADVIEIPTGTTNVTIAGDLTISGDDLFMATNTSGAALIADGTNFNPVVISGDAAIATNGALTIASTAIESGMLNNNIISGQTELASGLATTDEILVSDAGTLKRVDVSILTEVTDGSATALAIALG